jgi:hypothetical protein
VLTLAPKKRSEIDGSVDRPYSDHEIVSTPRYPLAPLFAPLSELASEMTILKGVHVNTANHPVGVLHFTRLRLGVSSAHSTFAEIIGMHSDGTQALSAATLGEQYVQQFSPEWTDLQTVIPVLEKMSSDEIRRLSEAMREKAGDFQRQTTIRSSARGADEARDAAEFFARAAHAAKPNRDASLRAKDTTNFYRFFEDAAWIVENDLARSVFVHLADWDTHLNSDEMQAKVMPFLVGSFKWFVNRLKTSRNRYGSLFDQTLIMIGSELGRFPKTNTFKGKDHFPEVCYAFTGAGVRKGESFGATGRFIEALPIDVSTGRQKSGGHRVNVTDVGTTLLRVFGVAPEPYGYLGETLDFLRS